MELTLPVLYLATERRGWCQFLRAVPMVGRGRGWRAEAVKVTDWHGTVVAADIALLVFRLLQVGPEELRVTSRLLADERTRRCSLERRAQLPARNPQHCHVEEGRVSLSLFLLLSFFFAPSTYVIYTVRAYSHASDPPKTISLPELVVSQVPLSTEANLLGCRLACSNAPRPAPRIDGLLTRR